MDIDRETANIDALGRSLDDLRRESRSGIAAAAPIELTSSAPGKTLFNAGTASFNGEVALGIIAVHRLRSAANVFLGGASFAGQETLVRIGVSFAW